MQHALDEVPVVVYDEEYSRSFFADQCRDLLGGHLKGTVTGKDEGPFLGTGQ